MKEESDNKDIKGHSKSTTLSSTKLKPGPTSTSSIKGKKGKTVTSTSMGWGKKKPSERPVTAKKDLQDSDTKKNTEEEDPEKKNSILLHSLVERKKSILHQIEDVYNVLQKNNQLDNIQDFNNQLDSVLTKFKRIIIPQEEVKEKERDKEKEN